MGWLGTTPNAGDEKSGNCFRGAYRWSRLLRQAGLDDFPSGTIRPTVAVPHVWAQCCSTVAMDLIDFQSVWGFGEQILRQDWARRVYGTDTVFSAKVEKQWERVKKRLRNHGIQVRVWDAKDCKTDPTEWRPGELSWMTIESSEHNKALFEKFTKRLDSTLLGIPERVWRHCDQKHQDRLKARQA